MFNMKDVDYIAKVLKIKFDKFSKEDFLEGINIELEHGTRDPNTNVTNDHLLLTSKIALAHLNEFSNYYNRDYGLPMFEQFLKTKQNEKQNKNY